jgi:hypothetical protein
MPIQIDHLVITDGSAPLDPVRLVDVATPVRLGSIRYLRDGRLLGKPEEGAQRVRITGIVRQPLVMDAGTTYYAEKA